MSPRTCLLLAAFVGMALALPAVFEEPKEKRAQREMLELKAMMQRHKQREAARAKMPGDDPEVDMDTMQVLFHWGYYPQEAQVVTPDGYILQMHRVPCNKGVQSCEQRPVIFVQHGLESSSQDWVANMPWQNAAMMFADAGFDVWMGNFRGNMYGRSNINIDPNSDAFWYFSYTEMGEIDLPTMINYVLSVTGQDQIAYVGHSEGTMTSWICFSENPQLAKKISHNFALAPIGKLGHIQGLLRYIAPFSDELGVGGSEIVKMSDNFIFNLLGDGEFLPSSGFIHDVEEFICSIWVVGDMICDNVMFLIMGPDTNQMNQTRTDVYVAHAPAGTSTQNVVHFGQNANTDKFQKYDYGTSGNQQHYGQDTPPLFDLSKYNVPTYMFTGQEDWLADPTDVQWLLTTLADSIVQHTDLADTNHLDFVWGLNAAGQVYTPIINIMKADLAKKAAAEAAAAAHADEQQ